MPTPNNKINPVARYLFALSFMIVAYTAYAKLAVPILEGPPVAARAQVAYVPRAEENQLTKNHLLNLLPPDAWELQPCKTLLTPQGTVYFQQWDRIDDEGTYRLTPFTLVINDPTAAAIQGQQIEPGKKQPTPVVLRAFEHAELKFSKPLSANSGNEKAEMESAHLQGQVTVYRPANLENKEEQLRIVTRSIQINRQYVFTLNEVDFEFGMHRGRGRNLSIRLAHEHDGKTTENEAPSNSFSTINGIEQLELASVRELILQPVEQSNRFLSADEIAIRNAQAMRDGTTDPQTSLSLSNQKTPLRLSCDGPFVFRIEEQKAWFRDNVVVQQLDQFGDNLRCDSMEIDFDRGSPTEATGEAGKASTVKSLLATGTAARPARIESRSRQTVITGERLAFDVVESTIKASGSVAAPVVLQNNKLRFQSPSLQYRLQDDNSLGPLDAAGPGELRGIASKNAVGDRAAKTFLVRWGKMLSVRQEDSERLRIELDEQAVVNLGQSNGITGDALSFLVWQLPVEAELNAADFVATAPSSETSSKTKWEYFPSQLTSSGNVGFRTPRLQGRSKTLVANWARPAEESIRDQAIRNLRNQPDSKLKFQPEAKASEYFADRSNVALVGFNASDETELKTEPETGPQTDPLWFEGDQITVNLIGGLESMQVRDLNVAGDLHLANRSKTKRAFDLYGTGMKLFPQGTKQYRVLVSGTAEKPAAFKTDGFDLSGRSLHLDQVANTIWVHGAGKLAIDDAATQPDRATAISAAGDSDPFDGGSLERINIAWNGGMIFDGSKIYFERDIVMDALQKPKGQTQTSIRTLSQGLKVELSQPLNFADIKTDPTAAANKNGFVTRSNPKVRTIELVSHVDQNQLAFKLASHQISATGSDRPVVVESKTLDSRGNLTEMQKLLVPNATVNAETGDIAAGGPGSAITWQQASSDRKGGLKGFSNRSQTTPTTGIELTCAHVNFDGRLVANSIENKLNISGNTRTAWSTVKDEKRVIDPDRPDLLPIGAAVLRSEELRFARWQPRSADAPENLLEAKGNATVASQLFEAMADRITYSDLSDVMTIEGSSQSPAKLSYRQTENSTFKTLQAAKLRYNLADKSVNMNDIKEVQGSGMFPQR